MGKARSRLNSRKHGLTAKTLIIVGEHAEDFEELRSALFEQYDPQSALEFELVERLARILFRLRRVPFSEPGNLACSPQRRYRGTTTQQRLSTKMKMKWPTGGRRSTLDLRSSIDGGTCQDALEKLGRHEIDADERLHQDAADAASAPGELRTERGLEDVVIEVLPPPANSPPDTSTLEIGLALSRDFHLPPQPHAGPSLLFCGNKLDTEPLQRALDFPDALCCTSNHSCRFQALHSRDTHTAADSASSAWLKFRRARASSDSNHLKSRRFTTLDQKLPICHLFAQYRLPMVADMFEACSHLRKEPKSSHCFESV